MKFGWCDDDVINDRDGGNVGGGVSQNPGRVCCGIDKSWVVTVNINLAATHRPHRKIPLINIGFTQTKPTQKNG
ncbi:hypothetical protein, partial [Lyngbya sp. CCY1209]|uniref:hypothetical protein n=1 Tax=Lyngbya sp. CCY1209 TaxID=2886103 RepID=UPI002D21485C